MLEILKLGTSKIAHIIGFYLSFLLVVGFKKTAPEITDLLTAKGLEYVGLTVVLYFITYSLAYSFIHMGLVNFSDWVIKKRFRGVNYKELTPSLDKYGKFMVGITKLNEKELGHQMGYALIIYNQYGILFTLVSLQLVLLLGKAWCWWVFGILLGVTIAIYLAIFMFRYLDQLRKRQ